MDDSDAPRSPQPDRPDLTDHAVAVRGEASAEGLAQNDALLRDALLRRAASLPPAGPLHAPPGAAGLFQSFLIGGFECSTHRRPDGTRVDEVVATGHAADPAGDYRMLERFEMRTVRDGARWYLIEATPGRYDWSSFLPMLRAADATGTQVIWDLAHYGWPDGLDIWSPDFVERFARFAGALARVVRDETDAVPFYTPVNEISFLAWAGGDVAYMNPFERRRGNELKAILVQAALAAIEAVRAVEPRARFVAAEPAINLVPRSSDPEAQAAARRYTGSQFEALDMLSGRLRPELGGRPECVDIVGVNYYLHNQWIDGGLPVPVDHPGFRPFHEILAEFHARYRRPIFVAETGAEGDLRAPWLRYVAHEVATAIREGVPVEGLCIYPITDYADWDDDRPCPTGLFGLPDRSGTRPLYQPLADEIALLGDEA